MLQTFIIIFKIKKQNLFDIFKFTFKMQTLYKLAGTFIAVVNYYPIRRHELVASIKLGSNFRSIYDQRFKTHTSNEMITNY